MAHSQFFHSSTDLQITNTTNATASIAMILWNILSSATSFSTQGSERLPEIAKFLAPAVRTALGEIRHQDEFCLNCSTVLVAIGVFLEVFEIIHELREKTGPFKFRRPKMPNWMLWAGFAGWLMIVGGVAGEFIFESAVSTRSEELESISNALLGDAEISATEASKSAFAAQSGNTELAIELLEQEKATAEATKEAALANAKLGGWKLDEAAKRRFAAQVKKFPGTPFDLAVNPVEAPFMEDLDALLTSPSVGWVRQPPRHANGADLAILIDGKASIILSSGIVLEVDQDQVASLKPALEALGTALHEELDLKKVTLHLVPPGSWGRRIHIIIGKRQ